MKGGLTEKFDGSTRISSQHLQGEGFVLVFLCPLALTFLGPSREIDSFFGTDQDCRWRKDRDQGTFDSKSDESFDFHLRFLMPYMS